MLVLLHFHELGYTPFELAFLFLFYEFFGIVTNLVGGWLAARLGLKATLVMGLGTQVVALGMLALAPDDWLVVAYVMAAQALSGIAKDLTKMSSKSAVKLVAPKDAPAALFSWVAILTGSKNALKGVGFFLGGLLLTLVGFQAALLMLMGLVLAALLVDPGAAAGRPRHARGRRRSSARCSRRTGPSTCSPPPASSCSARATSGSWSALPVFLRTELDWSFWEVGTFLAIWIIGYGIVQASAPALFHRRQAGAGGEPDGHTAVWLAFVLAAFPAAIAIALEADVDPALVVVLGLIGFGVVFALNSSVHSYLILAYSDGDKVAMNVGFYYMANAGGRLVGTLLSGLLYQWQGLVACLWASVAFVLAAGLLSLLLPTRVTRSRSGLGRRPEAARGR